MHLRGGSLAAAIAVTDKTSKLTPATPIIFPDNTDPWKYLFTPYAVMSIEKPKTKAVPKRGAPILELLHCGWADEAGSKIIRAVSLVNGWINK